MVGKGRRGELPWRLAGRSQAPRARLQAGMAGVAACGAGSQALPLPRPAPGKDSVLCGTSSAGPGRQDLMGPVS